LTRKAFIMLSSSVDINAMPKIASLRPLSESVILVIKLLNFSISWNKKFVKILKLPDESRSKFLSEISDLLSY